MGLTKYFMKDRYYSLTNQITVFVTSRIEIIVLSFVTIIVIILI